MKWRLAMRIASLPDENGQMKGEWNPGLSNKHQTSRPVHKKRWEDEINEFLEPEEIEETKGNEIKNRTHGSKWPKNRGRWKAMESDYASTAAVASADSLHSRRCPPQDPTRTLPERREVGRLRGGEHCEATHQGPD